MDLKKKEDIEINYWKESKSESPEKFLAGNFLNKTQECRHFNYKIEKYISLFRNSKKILEVGSGQGWASCYMKKFYLKNAHFTVTDISPYALESLKYWEQIFQVKIDKSFAAKSYEIDEPENQYDLIFCYSAAHHFVKYKETLIELKRLVKKGGHILFLYEPTSSKLFYSLYLRYVNKMPHSTPEDVIIPKKIQKICDEIDLEYTNFYDSNQTIKRSFIIATYFKVLRIFKFLQPYVPSSSDLIFTKK